MKQPFHAVIFDLDGVLADTVKFHFHATKQVADEEGLPFTEEMNQKYQGQNRAVLIEALVNQTNKHYSSLEKEQLGIRKNLYFQQLISTLTKEDILPGMYSFLMSLKKENIKIAVASSSSNARTTLENLEIIHLFDHIVDIRKIKELKPNPEIFMKAADYLGISHHKCIVIEDSEAGIKAIKRASMFSVGVGNHQGVKQADWHVINTEEITMDHLIRKYQTKLCIK
ncbi:beta-phosphoglucomutase [Evansella sp. AB-rgal1]|uniref:beta-phosphoglucomutase n=1 Tax=Evansella sp. AB-rgal1 TaxID=3242696 RepID=UPI00359E350F